MNFDQEMQAALTTFTVESLELLQTMEDDLLNIELEEEPTERINAIFRVAHTIKGSAGLFSLDHIVAFTHVVESVLDSLRDGKLNITAELTATLLPCCDHIALLIRGVIDGQLDTEPVVAAGLRLLDELQPFLNAASKTSLAVQPEHPARVENLVGSCGVANGNWHLSLRFGPDLLREGMDPLVFIRYLGTLGEIVHLTTLYHSMPDAETMDAESCYLGFEIDLKSAVGKQEIENVFEFVRESSTIHMWGKAKLDQYINLTFSARLSYSLVAALDMESTFIF